jgi:hypothetical protein
LPLYKDDPNFHENAITGMSDKIEALRHQHRVIQPLGRVSPCSYILSVVSTSVHQYVLRKYVGSTVAGGMYKVKTTSSIYASKFLVSALNP